MVRRLSGQAAGATACSASLHREADQNQGGPGSPCGPQPLVQHDDAEGRVATTGSASTSVVTGPAGSTASRARTAGTPPSS
jgi:hypothetical protein